MKNLALLAVLCSSSVALAAPPKPDADMKKVLDKLATLGGKPIESLTPDEARKQPTPTDAVMAILQGKSLKPVQPEPVDKVQDITYPDAAGEQLAARVYTPKAKGKGPMPVVLYFHGGGWVIANINVYDSAPRSIANLTGAIVVSVEYRNAPEHKFPAAHDDAFAAYKWVRAQAASWGGDPERIALAGESAGGNLAINTAIRARDEKAGPVSHMLLVYPVAGKDTTTASYLANADAKPLNKPMMEWFVKQVFAKPTDTSDPRLDLVSRTDLAGLPPATLITAEIDPLRSEGQQLAKNLAEAGVKVDAIDVKGVTHEFFGMGAVVLKSKAAMVAATTDLKKSFAPKPAAAPKK